MTTQIIDMTDTTVATIATDTTVATIATDTTVATIATDTTVATKKLKVKKQADKPAGEAAAKEKEVFNELKKQTLVNVFTTQKKLEKTMQDIDNIKQGFNSAQKKKLNSMQSTFAKLKANISTLQLVSTSTQLEKAVIAFEKNVDLIQIQYQSLKDLINDSVQRQQDALENEKLRAEKAEKAKAQKLQEKEEKKQAKLEKAEKLRNELIASHNAKFPIELNIKGLIAKRLVDGETLDFGSEKIVFEPDANGDYMQALIKIADILQGSQYKLAVAAHFVKNETCKKGITQNQPSTYESFYGMPLRACQSKFPFELDFQTILTSLKYNSLSLVAVSIYTEALLNYAGLNIRDNKTNSFITDKREHEYYILDYSKVDADTYDSITGFYPLTDNDVDEIESVK